MERWASDRVGCTESYIRKGMRGKSSPRKESTIETRKSEEEEEGQWMYSEI